MHRLPFNPEPLLAFFMTKESAGSMAGDLEERFSETNHRKGRMRAILWFGWALFISLPTLIAHALGTKRFNKPVFVVLDSNLLVSFLLS